MVKAMIANQSVPRGVTVNHVQRWCGKDFGAKTSADSGRAYTFQISDLNNVTELTNLYDFYSIDKIDVQFALQFEPKDVGTGLVTYPTIIMTPDYNDPTLPLTEAEVFEYGKTVSIEQFSATKRIINTTLVPRIANTVYRSGITNAYTLAQPSSLVDIRSTDAQHFGLKTWVIGYNTTGITGGAIFMRVKYYLRLVATK
jgi:hypothetical protein